MGEEHAFWNILIDEMPVELSCTTPGCNHGDGGARPQLLSLTMRLKSWTDTEPKSMECKMKGVGEQLLRVERKSHNPVLQ